MTIDEIIADIKEDAKLHEEVIRIFNEPHYLKVDYALDSIEHSKQELKKYEQLIGLLEELKVCEDIDEIEELIDMIYSALNFYSQDVNYIYQGILSELRKSLPKYEKIENIERFVGHQLEVLRNDN